MKNAYSKKRGSDEKRRNFSSPPPQRSNKKRDYKTQQEKEVAPRGIRTANSLPHSQERTVRGATTASFRNPLRRATERIDRKIHGGAAPRVRDRAATTPAPIRSAFATQRGAVTGYRTKRPTVGPVKKFQRPKPPRTQISSLTPRIPKTSWGEVSDWYDAHLAGEDTYHNKVLLPNLLRLVEPHKGEVILDLACGQGFFTKAFAEKGAATIGVDVSEELISIAKKSSPQLPYHVASAENIPMIPSGSVDKVTIVLAIQNIEHTETVFAEAERVLAPRGTFHIVMNHPAFRIPKGSSWEYDEKRKSQYRRLDQYLSESRVAITMHPGDNESEETLSFHRPLQYYFKALAKVGLTIDRLEEWISHKTSDSGPRAKAENNARKEFPLFLYLRARK